MTDSRDSTSNAASPGHTFVCYARHDEGFVLRIASAMRDRAVRIWIDQWGIQPGADWNKGIDDALRTCQTFLIVLSPAAVASDEVRGELRAALNAHKRIIPVLFQPCEIPTRLLLTQYIDFTRSTAVTDASLDHLAGVLRGDEIPLEVIPPSGRDHDSRHTLLEDVQGEVSDRLGSVVTIRPVPILFERQHHQVERAWDGEAGVPARRPQEPRSADIVGAFDDAAIDGKLLILGGPGSGKTTALLQIVQALVARALVDDGRAVPVIVSLASWKGDRPIGEWLIDEVKAKYGVRVDLGVRWRDERRIAPLLDGLDELPSAWQPACVDAINVFQQTYRPPFLVVCCRLAEYENLPARLRLRGAVCLLALDEQQIGAFLVEAGDAGLATVIRGDPALLEMARSPLLLSFMSAQPLTPDVQRWQDAPSAADRRQRIFQTYLVSHASPARDRQPVSADQMVRWLGQLAAALAEQGQSEFLIERMQPAWLARPRQRAAYRAGVFLVSTAFAASCLVAMDRLFGLAPRGRIGRALSADLPSLHANQGTFDWLLPLSIAAVVGVVIASRPTIVPVETVVWPRATRQAVSWGRAAARAGLDYGLLLGVVVGIGFQVLDAAIEGSALQRAGVIVGTAGAALAAVFLARITPSESIRQARRPDNRYRMLDALTAAVVSALPLGCMLLWGTRREALMPLVVAVLLSATAAFAIVGFSALTGGGRHRLLLDGVLIGALGGAAIGALPNLPMPRAMSMVNWIGLWSTGGLIVGLLSGMLLALAHRWARPSTSEGETAAVRWAWQRWLGLVAGALIVAGVVGVTAEASTWGGSSRFIRDAAGFLVRLQGAFFGSLAALAFAAVSVPFAAAGTVGILGLLAGALSGAAGLDVARRLVPNQGIRQSAVNALAFAGLGILTIGVPYGLVNLAVGAIATRTWPDGFDVIRIGIGAGTTFGVLAGLLPGAACIQHFVLRLVLWAEGRLPLRLAWFLDVATRRRLLQRVGGRYRFIHVLLRDHLAEAAQRRALAR